MHQTFIRRARPFLAIIFVAIGFIAILPGVAECCNRQDDGTSKAMPIFPGDVVAASGSQLWNRTWGGPSYEFGREVWIDSAGNVYTCGETNSFSPSGFSDIVLMKWDAAGNQLWNRTWGGTSTEYGRGVWGDGAGNVYTCGSTNSFGAGSYDMVLVKWDASGNLQWYRTWGGSEEDYGCGVWGDGTSVYTCGFTNGFGVGVIDGMLVKWNATGNVLWYRLWGGASDDEVYSVWGDGAGNVYTCGGTASFGDILGDIVLVKWDASGNVLWYRKWGGSSAENGFKVCGDGVGNIYVCGMKDISAGSYDMVLVKWDASGNLQWYRTWGGSSDEWGSGVWCDGAGNVYTCGDTYSFGAGSADMALVKWDAAGKQLWNRTWGGTSAESGRGVWGDGAGNVYTCGETYGFGAGGCDIVLVKWTTTQPTNQDPAITHPSDITYAAGQMGNTISWTTTDTSTGTRTYTIYRNGTSIASGTWTSGIPVTVNVDGLTIRSYNYTIITSDGLGGTAQDTVIVTVIANQAPTINHPADITFTVGQTGHIISWIITDATTGTRAYTILRNGTLAASGTWMSGTQVTLDVNGLTAGSYIYTINATDGLGESARDSAIVMVIPNTTPRIICTISQNFSVITWMINDTSTGTTSYTLYRNGAVVANGTWTSGLSVNASTSGLATGVYNFTIVVTDGLQGQAQVSVLVVVVASGPANSEHPRDDTPGIAWIAVIVVISLIGLAIIMLVIRLRTSGGSGTVTRTITNAGTGRRRLTSDDWLQEVEPVHLATTSPLAMANATEQGTPSYCSRCGNAMPPEFKHGKYCGYCGEPFTRVSEHH